MDKLDSINRIVSRLSIKQIENLSDAEIRDLAVARPFHPGQLGFMLDPKCFKTEGHLSQAMFALVKRLRRAQK